MVSLLKVTDSSFPNAIYIEKEVGSHCVFCLILLLMNSSIETD